MLNGIERDDKNTFHKNKMIERMNERKEIEAKALYSLEHKMKSYQFAEVLIVTLHLVFVFLSIATLILSMLAIVMIPEPIHFLSDSIPNKFIAIALILLSVIIMLTDMILFSSRLRLELKILNNKISSLYDSYRLTYLSFWGLKREVESLINHHIKNGSNIFFQTKIKWGVTQCTHSCHFLLLYS